MSSISWATVCNFNSIGIQSSGGAGKVLAQWMRDGKPPMDLWDVDVRRTFAFQSEPDYLRQRTIETLGLLYAMHWPHQQYATSRNARLSPLHQTLLVSIRGPGRPHSAESKTSSPGMVVNMFMCFFFSEYSKRIEYMRLICTTHTTYMTYTAYTAYPLPPFKLRISAHCNRLTWTLSPRSRQGPRSSLGSIP